MGRCARTAEIFLLHKAQHQTRGGGSGPILMGPGFLGEEIIGLSIEHQDSNKA